MPIHKGEHGEYFLRKRKWEFEQKKNIFINVLFLDIDRNFNEAAHTKIRM